LASRGDHALRQFLRRRRLELEPRGARHHPLSDSRRTTYHRSDGKFVRDYFYVEDGAAAYMLLAERLFQIPNFAAPPIIFPMKRRSACWNW